MSAPLVSTTPVLPPASAKTRLGYVKQALADNPLDLNWKSLLVRLATLILVSLSMLALGSKINGDKLAVTRYMASSQAPIGAEFYPDTARQQISVLMYDTQFLSEHHSAWPISYMDHADWLERIAGHPDGRPRAIFLDITFGQQRNDSSLPRLIETLCRIRGEYGVPIFLAALASPVDGQLHVRPEIQSASLPDTRPCVTLVGVRYTPDPVDRLAWNYPLTTHLEDGQWQAGDATAGPSFRSAAMTMAQDVGGIDLGPETEPMALIWGAGTPGIQHAAHKPDLLANCAASTFSWTRLVPDLLRQIWEDSDANQPPCPIHQTLSMAQLERLSEAELSPYLVDRYVMVGAAVAGYNDLVNSPVQGLIPGVYLHAMALDNLLTYGGDYKQNSAWYPFPPAGLLGAGLATILVVFVLHVLTRALRAVLVARAGAWLTRRPSIAQRFRWITANADTAPAEPGRTRLQLFEEFCLRVLRGLIQLLAWVLRLSIQAALALLLISLLQKCTRIGMLPVVELLGMTLFAEALGYVEKVRVFIPSQAEDISRSHTS